MKTLWFTTILVLLLAVPALNAADEMKAFPEAEDGMVRHVLQLQEQGDESVFRVELVIGKTVMLEERNRYFFAGQIEQEVIAGWGYTRYIVKELGPMGGTLMAVDPNSPKVARFITLSGDPYFVRYNSRLPIVVYVPEGVEVRYRIWSADALLLPMGEG